MLNSHSTSKEVQNLCILCGVDMGPQNPRQLCGKTKCYNIDYLEMIEISSPQKPKQQAVKTEKNE